VEKSDARSRSWPAERHIARLEARGVAVDSAHFRVALMEILALADNGHTRLDIRDGAHPKQLPVRVGVFAERLATLRGGTAAWRRLNAARYLSDPEILFGADISADAERHLHPA